MRAEDRIQKRVLYDITAPNRSTGIVGGRSSNILNWDDIRYPWAKAMYDKMLANFWTPHEIKMGEDKLQFSQLTPKEREAFKKTIGLLAFLDSIQTDYSSKVADYLTDSAVSAVMVILAQQEVIHNHSYSYVLSSITNKAEQDEIFEYWKHDPVLIERNEFIGRVYKAFVENPTLGNFLESVVADVVLEGLFFYSGFAFFYHLARRDKMVGTATMINYINRDEHQHVRIFSEIFKAVMAEHDLDRDYWAGYVRDYFKRAAELEVGWARHLLGEDFPGIDLVDLEEYIHFTANKRVRQMGVEDVPFPGARNTLPWIRYYEDMNLVKSDFFEQKSRTYEKVSDRNGFDAF